MTERTLRCRAAREARETELKIYANLDAAIGYENTAETVGQALTHRPDWTEARLRFLTLASQHRQMAATLAASIGIDSEAVTERHRLRNLQRQRREDSARWRAEHN